MTEVLFLLNFLQNQNLTPEQNKEILNRLVEIEKNRSASVSQYQIYSPSITVPYSYTIPPVTSQTAYGFTVSTTNATNGTDTVNCGNSLSAGWNAIKNSATGQSVAGRHAKVVTYKAIWAMWNKFIQTQTAIGDYKKQSLNATYYTPTLRMMRYMTASED